MSYTIHCGKKYTLGVGLVFIFISASSYAQHSSTSGAGAGRRLSDGAPPSSRNLASDLKTSAGDLRTVLTCNTGIKTAGDFTKRAASIVDRFQSDVDKAYAARNQRDSSGKTTQVVPPADFSKDVADQFGDLKGELAEKVRYQWLAYSNAIRMAYFDALPKGVTREQLIAKIKPSKDQLMTTLRENASALSLAAGKAVPSDTALPAGANNSCRADAKTLATFNADANKRYNPPEANKNAANKNAANKLANGGGEQAKAPAQAPTPATIQSSSGQSRSSDSAGGGSSGPSAGSSSDNTSSNSIGEASADGSLLRDNGDSAALNRESVAGGARDEALSARRGEEGSSRSESGSGSDSNSRGDRSGSNDSSGKGDVAGKGDAADKGEGVDAANNKAGRALGANGATQAGVKTSLTSAPTPEESADFKRTLDSIAKGQKLGVQLSDQVDKAAKVRGVSSDEIERALSAPDPSKALDLVVKRANERQSAQSPERIKRNPLLGAPDSVDVELGTATSFLKTRIYGSFDYQRDFGKIRPFVKTINERLQAMLNGVGKTPMTKDSLAVVCDLARFVPMMDSQSGKKLFADGTYKVIQQKKSMCK